MTQAPTAGRAPATAPGRPVITAADMRDRLLSLNTAREALAATEPIASVPITIGDQVRFRVDPSWSAGVEAKKGTDLVDAVVSIGTPGNSTEYRLTKDSLLEATSLCGIPKGYVQRTPANLIEPQLNYWWQGGFGSKAFKLLAVGDGNTTNAMAFTRESINPFSNLRLVEQALEGIEAKYGQGEVLVDYKFAHSLRRTHLRLVVPEYERAMTGTGTDNDTWSTGIQIKNSLIGAEQTSIEGYLLRWWCTNGAIDTSNNSGVWSRRSGGQGDEVYQWARQAVDEILGGLEHSLDKVQEMVDIPLDGEVNDVLRDVFNSYRVPAAERTAIIENMVDSDQLNMYGLMQAITQAANTADVDPGHVDDLMRVGGDLPHTAHSRCGECHRLVTP